MGIGAIRKSLGAACILIFSIYSVCPGCNACLKLFTHTKSKCTCIVGTADLCGLVVLLLLFLFLLLLLLLFLLLRLLLLQHWSNHVKVDILLKSFFDIYYL